MLVLVWALREALGFSYQSETTVVRDRLLSYYDDCRIVRKPGGPYNVVHLGHGPTGGKDHERFRFGKSWRLSARSRRAVNEGKRKDTEAHDPKG
jgi:hypothetical protein